jgi:hypothetical protein
VLKQVPVILLLVGFLGQTFSKCFIFLDYQLNKNYIAANLCENRNRPEMKCAGKCYLCRRLKNEEKKDQDNPERKAENKFESTSFPSGLVLHPPVISTITVQYPHFQESVSISFTGSVFHPPQG